MTAAARPSFVHPLTALRSNLEHWQRVGLGIRLAYNPAKADVLRYWLSYGARLVEQQAIGELVMLRLSVRLLLQTAQDAALPWCWRSMCLDHTARPLARLTVLLRPHDPLEVDALRALVQTAQDRLNDAVHASRHAPGPGANSGPTAECP